MAAAGTGSAFQAIGIASLALGACAVVMSFLLLISRRDVASGIADVVLGRQRAPHGQMPSRPTADASGPAPKAAAGVRLHHSLRSLLDWLEWHLIPSRRRTYDYMTAYLLARRAGLGETDTLASRLRAKKDLSHGLFYRDLVDERLRTLWNLSEGSHRSRRDLPDDSLRAVWKQGSHGEEDQAQVLIDLLLRSSQSRHLDAGRCMVILTTLLDAETETRMAVKDQADLIDKLRHRLDNLLAKGEGAT